MAFQFSLAAVLRIRRIVEEREERMLQKILYEISQTALTLERINVEIANSSASRHTDRFKSMIARNLHDSYGEMKSLGQSRAEFESQLQQLGQLRDKQVKIYDAARQNREMLTDMREEKQDAYASEMARREQKTLDDNYIARRGRS